MINTVEDLTKWVNHRKGAAVTGEQVKWILREAIIVDMSELIVGAANHEPIAVLPEKKTKSLEF